MTHRTDQPDLDTVRARILASYRAQNAAMLAADTEQLDALLHDDYVAVHIGGYRQPKREWLAQIRSGRMAYHSITEQSTVIGVHGDTATLEATALVDATIYGGRATWPIRSSTNYARSNGQWKAVSSTASTY